MASELLGTLESRRSAVEKCGETWESAPAESSADASHFTGVQFGKAPDAGAWLQEKLTETPEEDAMADAIDDVLKSRGCRPSHAPAPVTSDDARKIDALADSLMALQRKKLQERGQLENEKEMLAKREAEVAALEEALRREREAQEIREEELRNYPRPTWLEKYEGTINVAVSGNSGVGKSLLINRIRRLKPGARQWAQTGVKETTMEPTMYTFPGRDNVRLWDLPGADTENFPREEYIRTMGLRYFDTVLIVSAARFTTTEIELRHELEKHRVPFLMVRTKVDIDVWNNHMDNKASEDMTLLSIRNDLRQQHGVQRSYLVSSRDPEKYDMPLLLREVLPGLKQALDANAPVFEPGDVSGWGDAWSLPLVNCSPLLSGIQGQWMDAVDGTVYIVDGIEVHVTLVDGQAAIMTLTEDERGIWWNRRWYIEASSVANARKTAEMRWTPVDLRQKPLVWRWAC
jgi:small GTP-binding protein